MSKHIELGDIAKDKITGFQGVVVARSRYLTNVDRYTLQPREVKDGKPIGTRSFDAPGVVFVEKTDIVVTPVERGVEPIELGDTVKHQITGLEGVVVVITEWSEGCSIVQLQPKELKDGVPVDQSAFDERSLTIVERANPKPAKVRTGGPRPEPQRAR